MKESAGVAYEVLVAWCQDSPEMAAKEIIRLEEEIERLEAEVESLRFEMKRVG
jgi:NADH:ubiquinone oxidoreductase subunit B-like Fe-S oxidoreductase